MSKREILSAMTFGKRVAEEEADALASYFVETDQWHRIFEGSVDIVYGAKGAGKSAIYSLLLARSEELLGRGVLLVSGENPRGAPAFKDLVEDPPTSEREFIAMWRLYLLVLVAEKMRDWKLAGAEEVVRPLVDANILQTGGDRRPLVRAVLDYVRSMLRFESVEGEVKVDPNTGLPIGISGKVTLREPGAAGRKAGLVSVDSLLSLANEALARSGALIWVLLDRLDTAFAETQELEKNALRALFRVYLDMLGYERIGVKVFLRSDIWSRITSEGFREASHITRSVFIDWEERSLLNLVVRRTLQNEAVRAYYGITNADEVLGDAARQDEFFYRVFPEQVGGGKRQRKTFGWMLSRTADGSKKTAPRELIHLLASVREAQLKRLELGHDEPSNHRLFEGLAIKEALHEVSRTRLERTIYAEYPSLAPAITQLASEKTEHTVATLAKIWGVPTDEAQVTALSLVEIGFFELRGTKDEPQFWVPFLYRDALEMVQGAADEE